MYGAAKGWVVALRLFNKLAFVNNTIEVFKLLDCIRRMFS